MRKSRAITLTVLSALMLTACCVSMSGCGGRAAPDHAWYDARGNRIEERWKTDANGNRVLDEQGRPIPEPGVPFDRWHRPWVFVNGAWAPQAPPAGSSSSSSSSRRSGSSLWLLGGSGYRSTTGSPAYRSGTGSVSPSSGSSSISRGGFGSTGSSSSS